MTGALRAALVLGFGVAWLALARTAAAQSSTNACVAAFEDGQRQQLKGELERAAEQFALCSAPSCPARVRTECQGFLASARSSAPGVLLTPVDSASERPLDGVTLSIDGRESQPLDGRMVRLAPGAHQLAFQRSGYGAIRIRLTLRAGDPPQLIPLRFTAVPHRAASKPALRTQTSEAPAPGDDLPGPVPVAACEPIALGEKSSPPALTSSAKPPGAHSAEPPRAVGGNLVGGRRVAVVAAGIVGGLGAIGFAYFGLSARSADIGLDSCTPNCEPSQVDAIERDYLLANVSLGVGLAGAATASILWLTTASAERPERRGAAAPRSWSLRLGPVTTLSTRF